MNYILVINYLNKPFSYNIKFSLSRLSTLEYLQLRAIEILRDFPDSIKCQPQLWLGHIHVKNIILGNRQYTLQITLKQNASFDLFPATLFKQKYYGNCQECWHRSCLSRGWWYGCVETVQRRWWVGRLSWIGEVRRAVSLWFLCQRVKLRKRFSRKGIVILLGFVYKIWGNFYIWCIFFIEDFEIYMTKFQMKNITWACEIMPVKNY